nr:hypothetical protein [Tanacetum cinerariifolium]
TLAKVKKVNDEVRIQAVVGGKRVNIKESSIRRILRLDDSEVPKPHHGMSSAALWHLPSFVLLPIRNSISQETQTKEEVHQEPEVPPTESQAEYNVPLSSPSHDPLPSGEDSMKLKELMNLCTNLSNKVLNLESEVNDIKSTYKAKIEKLESMVERLEEENKEKVQAEAYNLDLDHQEKVLNMLDVNDEEPVGNIML